MALCVARSPVLPVSCGRRFRVVVARTRPGYSTLRGRGRVNVVMSRDNNTQRNNCTRRQQDNRPLSGPPVACARRSFPSLSNGPRSRVVFSVGSLHRLFLPRHCLLRHRLSSPRHRVFSPRRRFSTLQHLFLSSPTRLSSRILGLIVSAAGNA